MKYATQKRVLLEVTLIKLCRPAMDQNKDALLDRIRAIEKQLEDRERGSTGQGACCVCIRCKRSSGTEAETGTSAGIK